ncbi:hypothetical protein M5K25_021106 [Dendrobium thyrsiflorum]|uniref:Lachrymatory factor synthase n=1 Tax=Dendrobium thyrsiflorum TaxID=117978 RepID=A0ABD0UIJ4_DENTH
MMELEREKSLGEGVWRGFYTVAPASSHRSTSKSRFVLREVLKKKTALVSKDQVLYLLQEEEKEVKPESHFSWRKLEERALSLRGERVELEREKILGEGVWRGFYTVAPASSHRSTSKSRFVLREVLKKKTALVSKNQVLCLLQEEEKEVKIEGEENEPGCIRLCGSGLNWVKERLVAFDPVGHTYAYEITESNMGFGDYLSFIKLIPAGEEGCQVEWSFEADPVDGWTKDGLVSYMQTALEAMGNAVLLNNGK